MGDDGQLVCQWGQVSRGRFGHFSRYVDDLKRPVNCFKARENHSLRYKFLGCHGTCHRLLMLLQVLFSSL